MINSSDLVIIYLSFGAPFGVYYLVNGRTEYPSAQNWLSGLFAFLFWMPFAVKMLQKEILSLKPSETAFGKTPSSDSGFDKNILFIQKEFEKILRESNAGFSLYQFRELFERYSGLTAAVNAASDDSVRAEGGFEIFSISNKDVAALSRVCLGRRNLIRLSAHQDHARRDFSYFLNELYGSDCDRKRLNETVAEFAKLLKNAEALFAAEESAKRIPQTGDAPRVNFLENELWKRGQHELLPTNRPSSQMRAMTATSLPAND